MQKYRLISKKGEGTFSEVMKATNVITNAYTAIKCMKNTFRSIDQVNCLREIQALRRLNPHPNIIELEDVLYDKNSGRLALVFELMDQNIYEMIRERQHYLDPEFVRMMMWQLMKAVHHMHSNGIFHRDIKPENVLVKGKELKVADFGSCHGIHTQQPFTEYISTRWYRAPECLLTNGFYGAEMDVWGVGCVLFEIVAMFPLFPGKDEQDQIYKVHKILGTPSDEMLEIFRNPKGRKKGAAVPESHPLNYDFEKQEGTGMDNLFDTKLPHLAEDCRDLIKKLITYEPSKRPNSGQVLAHPYFKRCREAEPAETVSPKVTFQNPRKEEKRRKKEKETKLPQLAKGSNAQKKDKTRSKDKKKFNATAKEFGVSGNKHGSKAFKPSATIALGGAIALGGGGGMSDDDGMLSPDDGPFSDTDADPEKFSKSMSKSLLLDEKKRRQRLKYKKKKGKKNQQQQAEKEYYINVGAGGKAFNGHFLSKNYEKKQQQQKKKQAPALPSLAKPQATKQPKATQSVQEEEGTNGGGGLMDLMVTTQYQLKKKEAMKEAGATVLHSKNGVDNGNFNIHKSFTGPTSENGTTLDQIVSVRQVCLPDANGKS